MSRPDPATLAYGDDGLLPVVVQDVGSGAVLMVAWADRDAVEKTLATGDAWFWSRSRREPWRKGATSGNVLSVVEVRADCDADTLLYRVDPAGPACHTGDRTCFDGVAGEGGVVTGDARARGERYGQTAASSKGGVDVVPAGDVDADGGAAADLVATPASTRLELGWLWRVLEERKAALEAGEEGAEASYTARLLAAGVDRVARKVGEEATETVIAALRAAEHGAASAAGTPEDPASSSTRQGPGASTNAVGRQASAHTASARARRALVGEAADLLYHVLVLLMAAGADPADVAAELRRRHAAPRAGATPKPEGATEPQEAQ